MNMIKKTVMWAAALLLPVTQAVAAPVARVGETGYDTLAEALTAVKTGQTVEFLTDIEASSEISTDKSNISIDGKGFKLKAAADFAPLSGRLLSLSGADVTVKNIVFDGNDLDYTLSHSLLRLSGGNKCCTNLVFQNTRDAIRWSYVSAGSTVTFDDCVFSVPYYGIHFDGDGGTVNVLNSTVEGFCTFNNTFNFSNCLFTATEGVSAGYSILQSRNGMTVRDCTFDDSWIGSDAVYSETRQSGVIVEYYGIQLEEESPYGYKDFIGAEPGSISAIDPIKDANGKYLSGYFFTDSAATLLAASAQGLGAVYDADNKWWTLSAPVAQVTVGGKTTKYADLYEALVAAKASGAVCELLCDVDLTGKKWTPVTGFAGTFDGKGHKVTGLNYVNGTGSVSAYQYRQGFIGEVYGGFAMKDVTFEGISLNATYGSQVGLVGMSYGNVTFDNVDLKNCVVTGLTKTGLFLGQNDEGVVTVRNCEVVNSEVKANYSAALLVGLLNINSNNIVIENTVVDTDSQFTWISGEFAEKGDYYAEYDAWYAGKNKRVTDHNNAWTESRITSAPVSGSDFIRPVAQVNGFCYLTLAEVLKAAKSGDTIEILNGTWGADAVGTIDNTDVRYKSLTIQPAAGATVTFTSQVYLGYDDSSTANATMTVKNLNFENASLAISNYNQVHVEGCTFKNTTNTAGTLIVQDACCTNHKSQGDYPASQITIKDCVIDGSSTGASCIRLRNSGNVSITGCTVKNSQFNGILFESNSSVDNMVAKTVTVTGNTITEWNAGNAAESGRAIRMSMGGLADGSSVTVESNVFTKATMGLDTPDVIKMTEANNATVSLEGNDWNNLLNSEVSGNKALYTVNGATPSVATTVSTKAAVAQIGTMKYATLAEALNAAQSGDTVEIIKADEYDWPNAITKGIAIKGAVDGVTFPCGKNCTSGLEDVTLINLNLPFGQENYCGFTHCSNLVFDGCTISGLSNSYGPQTYRNCTFNQSKVEYCMWVYGNHVVYDGCTFNTWGKALNVYAESAVGYTLLVKDCTFNNEHDAVKPAVLIKSLRGAVELEYDVDIENCTIVGNWPDAEHPYADGQIQTCGLWDVEDTGKKISVTLDGALVWVNGAMPPVKIGNQGYATLSNAVEAVQNGETITLQKDNAEVFTADTAALFTIDPNGFAFTAANVTPREGCELVQNLDGTYAYRMQVVVRDQITKIVVEPKDEAVTETETKSAAVTVSGETAKEVLEGTKTVEFVVAGFGTVSFSPAAAKRLGLNMEKVADEAGGSVTGASSESTVTIGGADITDSPTPTTPTVIIDEEEHETYEVVQAISLTAIGEAIVRQAGSSATVRTNDEVFAEGKTAEGETATWTIPYSGVKPQVWFINTTKEPWTTNKVATTYNAETKKLTFVLNHFSDYSITDVEISAIVGAEKFRTLQEAFDFVTNKTEGTEVRLVKNSTATAKLAAGVMATLNLNDKTLKGSVTAGDGAILTVGDGTIDAGTGTFANGEGSGKVNIVSGTYKGVFPDESATTNVFVSGGWFQAPVPAANCAPGYVPKAEPEEGMYTVKNANIYIRDIGACQRYPWNGYVDITVDVCWDTNKTAKLYVTAWDKLTGEQLKMTGAELFEEGVEGSRSVDCAKGFVVEASQKKTLHLIWNSVEGVPKGYRKDRVGFGFAAKKTK